MNIKKIVWVLMMTLTAGMLCAEGLPKVVLSYQQLDCDTFNTGSLTFINDTDTIALGMQIRHRGATSTVYDKPSYAIKLLDKAGKKYETSFLGMRKDNYWILDAMAADKARMRNRISMDLWLEMAHDPWYKAQEKKVINGYRGKMVEVYVDTLPQGIYCLMERVDRKQLKLPKYVDSLGVQSALYKSIRDQYSGFQKRPTSCPSSGVSLWDNQWEVKHPDPEDGETVDWHPLYNMFRFVWDAKDKTFQDSIASYIDLPVWIDYELLCQFISARDNTSKNTYISFYDTQHSQRGLVTLWDIDHSFGRQYNGTEESDSYILFTKNRLSVRLRDDYPGYKDTLIARWAELRKTTFKLSHVDSLLDNYFDLYESSGMDTVEQNLWSGVGTISVTLDFASERVYIKDWLRRRTAFLDSIYQYTDPEEPLGPDVPTCKQEPCSSVCVPTKIIRNGQLFIKRGDDLYDCLGHQCN